jgi:hypothetical protein
MRRPEIGLHLDRAAREPHDFSFLAPCPSSGLIIHGDKDAVVPYKDVTALVDKLKTRRASSSSKGRYRRQPLLRRQDRAADGIRQPLSRQATKIERKPTAA